MVRLKPFLIFLFLFFFFLLLLLLLGVSGGARLLWCLTRVFHRLDNVMPPLFFWGGGGARLGCCCFPSLNGSLNPALCFCLRLGRRAVLYFLSYYIINNILLFNIMVAIIWEVFAVEQRAERQIDEVGFWRSLLLA